MVEGDPLLIPLGLARTVVSIAKQVDDPLLPAGLRLLAEMGLPAFLF